MVFFTPASLFLISFKDVSEKLGDKVSFYAVDVDESAGLAMMFNVNSVPCLVLLKDGKYADRSVGFRPEPQLTAWIDSNL